MDDGVVVGHLTRKISLVCTAYFPISALSSGGYLIYAPPFFEITDSLKGAFNFLFAKYKASGVISDDKLPLR